MNEVMTYLVLGKGLMAHFVMDIDRAGRMLCHGESEEWAVWVYCFWTFNASIIGRAILVR